MVWVTTVGIDDELHGMAWHGWFPSIGASGEMLTSGVAFNKPVQGEALLLTRTTHTTTSLDAVLFRCPNLHCSGKVHEISPTPMRPSLPPAQGSNFAARTFPRS